ncbi:CoA transferase [Croceicoccus sp. F390]|uniref:CoA transferase n=1 Tax=Croceicoccus esteveae TaxID=3075597 RepID=A0ABU2ZF26_9SPHN|nr:CoA transferase [Croceicoccus sp. F390]MDT0575201.1 CoA transferase [Croceicoccus sp. F390]
MKMNGPLKDLKVLDLSWGIAGPMTAMLLADHGAQVTRIERPQGDPFAGMAGYRVWHRGKRNAVLDLKDKDDHALFLRLAAEADVLVESFSPTVTERLGIDYQALAKINPRLIYCSITAYGEGTPDQDRPGYDALVAARSGLQYEQRGWPEGAVNHMLGRDDPFADVEIPRDNVQGADREGPLFVSSPWPSLGAFFSASLGIAAALFARERSGRGQRVTTSLQQGAMVCASGVWQRMEDPDAEGFDTWIMNARSPKGHFQGADGAWLHNWVPNPRFILESSKGDTLDATPDLTVQNDPDRFGIGPEELLVMAHYQPILAEAIRKFPVSQWVDAAAKAEVTMQPCRSVEESLMDPLLIADGCVTTVEDADHGPINQVGISYRLETSPGVVPGPVRERGADTEMVKAHAASLADPVVKTAAAAKPALPLAGVRVIDLGLAIAGPFGCQLLGDLGADVIKVNTLWDMYWHRTHIAYMANRNKRSIALMLKHPKAIEALHRLIATADVVQHNMRYGAVERLGLDYASLKERYPRLVYCHSRGFEKGPRMNLPGNDQTGACLAGIQHEDGALHTGEGFPFWSLTSLGDTGNGFLSAIGICNALMDRERTGKGQFVDTSIINAALLNTSYAFATADGQAVDRPRIDALQTGFGPFYRLYRSGDGKWLQVAAITDAQKAALSRIIGSDAEAAFAQVSGEQMLQKLASSGVPAELSDAQASRKLFDNATYKERGWTARYRHRDVGMLDQIGVSYNLSDAPFVEHIPPMIVGDATAALLAEIGYSDEEIDTLAQETAILCDPPRAGQKELASPWGM